MDTDGFVIPSTNWRYELASITKTTEIIDTTKYGLISGRSSAGCPRCSTLKYIMSSPPIRMNDIRRFATRLFFCHAATTYFLFLARFSPTSGMSENENPVPKIMNALRTLFTNEAAANSSVLCCPTMMVSASPVMIPPSCPMMIGRANLKSDL